MAEEPKAPTWEEILDLWENTGQVPLDPEPSEEPTPSPEPEPVQQPDPILTEEEMEGLMKEWNEVAETLMNGLSWLSLAPLSLSKWMEFKALFSGLSWPSFPGGIIEDDDDVPQWRKDVYQKNTD